MSDFEFLTPVGDTRERLVCRRCGFILYKNPHIIVGTVVAEAGQVLLCRRAIEPRLGFWTLPAGYLEMGEVPEEAARREAREEAQAEISLDGILALYAIRHINQVQIIFRGRFAAAPRHAPGPESLETSLFPWGSIPWSDIAFPSVRWALNAWHALGDAPLGPPATNPEESSRVTAGA